MSFIIYFYVINIGVYHFSSNSLVGSYCRWIEDKIRVLLWCVLYCVFALTVFCLWIVEFLAFWNIYLFWFYACLFGECITLYAAWENMCCVAARLFGVKSGGCDRLEYNMLVIECVVLLKRIVSNLLGKLYDHWAYRLSFLSIYMVLSVKFER